MNNPSDKRIVEVLSFLLQKVRICAELKYVTKVLRLAQLEPVPGSATYLAGLLNLAGESTPVIDLALYLGLQRCEDYSLETPILICSNEQQKIGMIVDNIIGLTSMEEYTLQMQDEFNRADSPFIAVVKIKNELTLLINMNRILETNVMAEKTRLALNQDLIQMAKIKHD
ncbi:MAG: chemotaxis protein CheW [Gammaproteobacteria bacterium]|nr:MAG: chemotaxis protein CheW [Gammaproteobacteria bacterium]